MKDLGTLDEREDYPATSNPLLSIFLISVLGLFLEMLLIRWISTEVRIFAYLQNTVLVVCFLGLGLGCFTSRQPIRLRNMLLPLFVLALLFAVPTTKAILGSASENLSVLDDLVIWYPQGITGTAGKVFCLLQGFAVTYFLMILILDIFIPIGRILGRLMNDHPRTILAYSANIAGSLIGTWLFVLFSIYYQPPVTWFITLGALTLFFINRNGTKWRLDYSLIAGIVILSFFAGKVPDAIEVIWSPYQKLVLKAADRQSKEIGEYLVTVNNSGYQGMIDSSKYNPYSQEGDPVPPGLGQYDIPLLLHPNPQKVLLVGAGTGNDAAGALRHHAREITAVEIDPAIVTLGKVYHPEKPYSSPAVRLINDDARSYLAVSKEKFDVIVFGLLDSHTTTAMTNARLDHYVYTKESIIQAKSLLNTNGVMVLSFEAQKQFIADRIRTVLREVFGQEPICFRVPSSELGWGGVIFVAGDMATAKRQIDSNTALATRIARWQQQFPVHFTNSTKITSDDWPYLYLKTPSIPLLFYLLGGLTIIVLIRCRKHLPLSELVSSWSRTDWHFFFLGAAFLLLEVQNISKASVVLGNTWDVNAVIVSGVLAMILLANYITHLFPKISLRFMYIGLIGTCLALYSIDLAHFAFLPYATKALMVGSLIALPMLFSGVIFIRSFASVPRKDQALGANLLGALIGAQLQAVTFIVGIKALLLIVAGFYLLSFFTIPRETGKGYIA